MIYRLYNNVSCFICLSLVILFLALPTAAQDNWEWDGSSIECKETTNWSPPSGERLNPESGANSTSGTNVQQTGSLQVNISPVEALSSPYDSGAKWRRVGTSTWFDSGATESNIPVGDVDIEYRDTAGYATPVNGSATITDGGTAVINVIYQFQPLTLSISSHVVTKGDEFTVTVSLNEGRGVRFFAIDLNYNEDDFYHYINPEVFEFTGTGNRGSLVPEDWAFGVSGGIAVGDNVPEIGVSIFGHGAYDVVYGDGESALSSGNGSIATINLKVKEDAPAGTYPLSAWTVSGDTLRATIEKGWVEVRDSVTPHSGSLQVNISPSNALFLGAKWRRVGTSTWLDNGATESDIPEGDVDIEYRDVAGFATPANSSATITDGGTTVVYGTYTAQPLILSASSHEVTKGEEFTVTVSLNEGFGVRNFGFNLFYDPAVFEFNGTAAKSILVPDDWTLSASYDEFLECVYVYCSNDSEATLPSGSCSLATINLTVKEDAPVGTYPLGTMSTPGSSIFFATPSNGSVKVLDSVIPHSGSLQVNISPANAVHIGAKWRRVGTSTWFDSGATESNIPEGDVDIEYLDTAGFATPADGSASITEGGTAVVNGTYIEQPFILSASSHEATKGEEFTVTVSLNEGFGVRNYSFFLFFDADVFEYSGASAKGVLVPDNWTFNAHYDEVMECADVSSYGDGESTLSSGSGSIATFNLTVKEDAPVGTHSLALMTGASNIAFATTSNGAVTVTSSGNISAGNAEGKKGETIEVSINLNSGINVGAFGCDIGWDSSVLTYVDSSKGSLLPDGWTFNSNQSGDSVRLGGYGTPDINGSGTIAVITFQINESASSNSTAISVSGVTDGLSAGGGGTVEVLDCVINYDVNGDGLVTPGDALMVFKHYLGTELISDSCALKKADANGDSSITPGDALIIFKEYLGLN